MPLTIGTDQPAGTGAEPVEFSVEDVVLASWLEDSGDYLRLEDEFGREPGAAAVPPTAEYSRASSAGSDRASSRDSRGR